MLMLIPFGVFAMCKSGLCYRILKELAAFIFMVKVSREKMFSLYRQAIPQTNELHSPPPYNPQTPKASSTFTVKT